MTGLRTELKTPPAGVGSGRWLRFKVTFLSIMAKKPHPPYALPPLPHFPSCGLGGTPGSGDWLGIHAL